MPFRVGAQSRPGCRQPNEMSCSGSLSTPVQTFHHRDRCSFCYQGCHHHYHHNHPLQHHQHHWHPFMIAIIIININSVIIINSHCGHYLTSFYRNCHMYHHNHHCDHLHPRMKTSVSFNTTSAAVTTTTTTTTTTTLQYPFHSTYRTRIKPIIIITPCIAAENITGFIH